MKKEEISSLIKDRLIFFMKKKNMSENNLASISNVKQTTLNHLMNTKGRTANTETLVKLCEGLEISIHEFFDFYPFNVNPKTIKKAEESTIDILIDEIRNMKKEIEELKKEENSHTFNIPEVTKKSAHS